MGKLVRFILNGLKYISFLAVLFIILVIYVVYFPYIHKKTVFGSVKGVKQIFETSSIVSVGNSDPSTKLTSFAVAVQDKSSLEIFTGSTEDRQWGVVKEGQCVEAYYYPYPPWNLRKAGTFYNVRLKRLFENCEQMDMAK